MRASMDFGLGDRVALVMGGSRGLGYACAEALVDEGCAVAIAARGQDAVNQAVGELSRHAKRDVTGHTADAGSRESLDKLVADVLDVHGRVDILVTNSGGPRAGGFDEVSDEDWAHADDVVLGQVVHLVRTLAPGMRERGWGRIVNILSSSYKEPIMGLVLSNTFRPAVAGLAKTLAAELGTHGITVNNIAPGRFDTARLRHLAKVRAEKRGGTSEDWMRRFGADSALDRTGEPRELGDVVAFLASDQARFVTGITVPVDGGLMRSL
jgi:3-oxoacyl-[acyl-carrier protein] reductase